jgi:SAM-dependent methyltransferase
VSDSVIMSGQRPNRWQELTGGQSGAEYAARFEALAASGKDLHGEATFCQHRLTPGAHVLDAGCGTGRVAIRLAELGCDVVGVDADASMLEVAHRMAPALRWVHADLADLPEEVTARTFDMVVLAGNVVPLLAEGSLPAVLEDLATTLRAGGLLVAGFGLDAAHLPPGCPVTGLEDYDEAAAAAGLVLGERYSTWDADPFDEQSGYAVSVHRRS